MHIRSTVTNSSQNSHKFEFIFNMTMQYVYYENVTKKNNVTNLLDGLNLI